MERAGETRLAPGALVAALAALFFGWFAAEDVGFRDAGEIGTAAYGLGVAHPTGFAADLLLLRAAAFLPLGHAAFRQNLCVALEAALALGLLAQLCDALSRALGVGRARDRWLGLTVGCAALAGWLTFTATATSVEVYSLALACGLAAAVGVATGRRTAGLAVLVVGFAPGLHVTAGLFALLMLAVYLPQLGGRAALRFTLVRLPALAAGALVIAYLPLASSRDPALDWGDPETLARVFDHLTAARIRSAYRGEMLSSDASGAGQVIAQWFELWPVMPFALLALAVGLRARPLAVLAPLALCTADLAYSVWINPMGAADRQVGHMAGAALCALGGAGVAVLCSAARRVPSSAVATLALGLATALMLRLPREELGDGLVASELLGSGGPLAAVSPRAVVLCSGDDACAAGLFALHVEGVRPDAEILPIQHLWDPTVLRRLRGTDPSAGPGPAPAPEQRNAAARARLLELLAPTAPRPVLLESSDLLRELRVDVRTTIAAECVPYLRPLLPDEQARVEPEALHDLDRLRRARLGTALPQRGWAQHAWSRAYGTIGEQALPLQPELAVRGLRTAVQLAPRRAVAWSNLGAALDAAGDLQGALEASRTAVTLAPARPTPWVNLARFTLRAAGPEAARDVLRLAAQAGVRDPRLDALARMLERGS